MGCGQSNLQQSEDGGKVVAEGGPKISEKEKVKIRAAKQQRRRLSVAPEQVGDFTGGSVMQTVLEDNVEDDATLKGSMADLYEIAGDTCKGYVPYNRNKVNQDRSFVKLDLQGNDDMALFGVMDGHGELGHEVSSMVKARLPELLQDEQELQDNVHDSVKAACQNMDDELDKANINTAFSGTTAVFSIKKGNRIYTCNIGDSRAVMCRQTNGKPEAIPLSFDQNPDNPGEKKRILAAGGRVEPLPGLPGEDCGPHRVWLADVDVPGLAMSRSFGDDVSHSVGVISTPEILEHKLQGNDIFAIWASDGVWEFLSNEQAVDIVWKSRNDLDKAAKELVIAAEERWREEEEVIDDITCVVIGFNRAVAC